MIQKKLNGIRMQQKKKKGEVSKTCGCPVHHTMTVILVPSMNKNLFRKRLANVCSIPVDNVPDGVCGICFTHFPDFMKKMEQFKKAETEGIMKGLDDLVQKLHMIAAFIFTFINVKGESGSKLFLL